MERRHILINNAGMFMNCEMADMMKPDEIDWNDIWTADVTGDYEDQLASSMSFRRSAPTNKTVENFFV